MAATLSLSMIGVVICPSVGGALEDSPKAILDEAWQIINREYVDASFNRTNWQATRQDLLSREYTSRDQAYASLRRAIAQLNDPYTRFMSPQQFQALRTQTSGEVSGIGIRLQRTTEAEPLTVLEPIADSPAARAGIQAGDHILSIDNQPTQRMNVAQAADLIKGQAGTPVRLRLSRNKGTPFDVSLIRERIELPTVRYTLNREGPIRVGYIRLSQFSSHAASQMRRAIANLEQQDTDGFVLDLRGNPGGLLYSSIEIARMWLEDGIIVRTQDREGQWETVTANRTALTQRPVVVLVDKESASSSEILTGALQDNQRAVVVGRQTFGKALVQSVHALSDGSGLAVTVSHYYTPKGTDISRRGIRPNVAVTPSSIQEKRLQAEPQVWGTVADPDYAQALTVLQQSLGRAPVPVPSRTSLKATP